MPVWFEGSNEIDCDIQDVRRTFENNGEHYTEMVSRMPGLSSVELIDQGPDFVTIKTNEGLMMRTNISKRIEAEGITVEFDEAYQAGSLMTATSHFMDEFIASDGGVIHRIVISNVQASGILGFFYKTFARRSMGKAFLKAYKSYLEQPQS